MTNPNDQSARPAEAVADDIATLTEEFKSAGWYFTSVWAAAASGPDKRLLVGQRHGIVLSAWNIAQMREKVAREERGR